MISRDHPPFLPPRTLWQTPATAVQAARDRPSRQSWCSVLNLFIPAIHAQTMYPIGWLGQGIVYGIILIHRADGESGVTLGAGAPVGCAWR